VGLILQRYGADVAIFENRALSLSGSCDDSNRNEARAYRGLMFERLLTRQAR
jgi:hypothetical protein